MERNINDVPQGGPGLQRMQEAFPDAYLKNNGWWEHDDNPTFGFRENENGFISIHSFTGRTPEEILALRGLTLRDITPRGYQRAIVRDKLDIHELAIAKKIDWHFLWSIGVEDGYSYHGRKYVKIVYHLSDGTPHTKVKVRKAIDGTVKHCWDEGTPGKLIPYGLEKLNMAREEGYLLIGEGETDAWACWVHNIPYLGVPGASSYKTLHEADLSDIPAIYILTEPDQMRILVNNGQGFYKSVHNQLRAQGYTGEIFCINFQEATGWKDPSDLHSALWERNSSEAFNDIINQAREQALPANDQIETELDLGAQQPGRMAGQGNHNDPPTPPDAPEIAAEGGDGDEAHTQAHQLYNICEQVNFYRTYEGTIFGSVRVHGHYKTEIIGEKGGFRKWLTARYYERYHTFASTTAIQQVIELKSAQAEESAPISTLFTRVAHHEGKVYLDLCDEDYTIIEIDSEGWRVAQNAPVHFRRTSGMLPLPMPTRGGSIDDLRQFVKVGSDNDWKMIVAYVLMLLHPYGPYPVLALGGEQGSAKSSATRFIRSLIDPHLAIARSTPQDSMALSVTAQNNWVYALENLSHIPEWLSDALCKLSTGSGDGKRKLYTDADEQIFALKRPTILNGIGDLVTRGDLLSRTIAITMPVMSKEDYREERVLNAEYEQARPGILGAILDATVMALRNIDSVKVIRLSRMADMTKWMCATEESLGWEAGSFLECYEENQNNGVEIVLDASQIAKAVLALMESRTEPWSGSSQELDKELRTIMGDDIDRKRWPSNPKTLSDAIKRLAPALRSHNISFEQKRTKSKRFIILSWIPTDDSSKTSEKVTQTEQPCVTFSPSASPCVTFSPSASPSTLPLQADSSKKGDKGDAGDADFGSSSSSHLSKEKREEKREKEEEIEGYPESASPASPSSPTLLPRIHDFKIGQWVFSPDGYGRVTDVSKFRVSLDIMGKIVDYHGDIAIGRLHL